MSLNESKTTFIHEALNRRKKEHQLRQLVPWEPKKGGQITDGRRQLVNFSGNDYLGLSKHPKVVKQAKKYIQKYGSGATASRLVCGTHSIHQDLEEKIADTFGWEAALLFNSGFQANSTIISTLTDRHALILADKRSHNSLLQGALSSRATFRRFEHNSAADLERQLKRAKTEDFSRIVVVIETLYSMDGDRSDVEGIAALTEEYNALFFVDDAHAIGVWGEQGLGLAQDIPGLDLVLGTCGKACGSFGAFLLCSEAVKQYLVNFCPGFIYTTALPPSVIGSIDAAIDIIPEMNEQRRQLRDNIDQMRSGIHKAGFSTGNSESQIIPIMVGEEKKTLALADYLHEKGFLAVAIRPPTVAKKSARIRITVTTEHNREQITGFLNTLDNWNNE